MSTYQYVWDIVRTIEIDAHDDLFYCPHLSWRSDEQPPYCHDCMKPGLTRLVIEGARDDEILPAFAAIPIPERRWIEATLSRLRTVAALHYAAKRPTAYAERMITEIDRLYPIMRRSAKGHRVSMSMMARRVGIDRDTIPDWVRRGWMRWPPDGENPQP